MVRGDKQDVWAAQLSNPELASPDVLSKEADSAQQRGHEEDELLRFSSSWHAYVKSRIVGRT